MAGLAIVPMSRNGFYKIVSMTSATNEALPTYIGVDKDLLPHSDMMIRYVYFLQNSEVDTVQSFISQFQGSVGTVETYTDLSALIFTDKSYNIRLLMDIVTELDKVNSPQVVSVIKLKRALADDVITLYNALKPTDSSSSDRAWAPVKKKSSLQYFPSDIILVSDPRTNSLILLGAEDAVTRVEEFIRKHVDEEIDYRDAPVHVYKLEYTNATDIQTVINSVTQYGSSSTVAQYGGVLDGEQYFSPMNIVADTTTNSLIINSTKKDYAALEKLIQQLDVPQKQIAFDFLLVQVSDVDTRTLGSQIAGSKSDSGPTQSTFLNGIQGQTSGIPTGTSAVVTNGGTYAGSLKESLASLITGSSSLVNTAGSTLVTFGKNIWGLLKIVKQIGTTHIIANPFLVTTNNTSGTVNMGVTRRIKTSDVYTSSSTAVASGYENLDATLDITVTPQVNEDNIINLSLTISDSEFTVTNDPNSPNTNKKTITTTASLAIGEVLVVGGIIKENISSSGNGVPVLSKIPLFGWFFKSKTKTVSKDHFVVFVAPRIVDPLGDDDLTDKYTQQKMEEAHTYLQLMNDLEMGSVKRDPIARNFFIPESETTISLFKEDQAAYDVYESDRNRLMEQVQEKEAEVAAQRKKKRRKKKSSSTKNKNSKKKKKRRRKSKFNQSTDETAANDSSASNPDVSDEDFFIQQAFPLTADTLVETSVYSVFDNDDDDDSGDA